MKRTGLVVTGFLVLALLHQDVWFWDDGRLVFGFLPVGLAYHVGFSLAAAAYWTAVVKFAWPQWLEKWADGGERE